MTVARQAVRAVIDRFYTVHHSKEAFEAELVDEINNARVRALSEIKQRVLDAVEHRIRVVQDDPSDGYRELDKLRTFIKGMVIGVEK